MQAASGLGHFQGGFSPRQLRTHPPVAPRCALRFREKERTMKTCRKKIQDGKALMIMDTKLSIPA
jgi:hypothetical protein